MTTPVALYIPNLLGYARIITAFLGLHYSTDRPGLATVVWLISGSLDFFDGKLARALNQCSKLGVLLDIFADNILRTSVWIAAASDPDYKVLAACIISLEWVTMLSTQLHAEQSGVHWKKQRENDPWLLRTVFANNFVNPLGILIIYGLFTSGMFAHDSRHGHLEKILPFFDFWKYTSYVGRAMSACVELWLCTGYLSMIIEKDTPLQ